MTRSNTQLHEQQHLTTLMFFLTIIIIPHSSQAQPHPPINTIVVLVLENRSFDHMLGWMKESLNPSIDGLTGGESNPRSTKDPNSPVIFVSDDARYVDPDPGHSFQAVQQQMFGAGGGDTIPTMLGFVEQALSMSSEMSEAVMKGFRPSNVPVYATLVKEFAVFDKWHSSLPGPTQPNRLFVYSGTSHGATNHDILKILRGYPQKTIFDSLHEDGFDFAIYFQSFPSTLLYKNLRRLKYILSKFHSFEAFKDHARKGKLRNLNVIEPRYFDVLGTPANDDHPSHDVAEGQRLVKEVYEALRSSPHWNQSLLIITYDEHGGFYDHVPPPTTGVPNPDGIIGAEPFFFNFDRLGVRVPTIMVSPWIKRGTVMSRPTGPYESSEFEHSSIPATIKKMFNLTSDFLSRRDAWAGTFERVLQGLSSPRTDCPEVLPEVRPLRSAGPDGNRPMSEFQSELVSLAAAVNGECFQSNSSDESSKKMAVKEADQYVKSAFAKFLRKSRAAARLDADESSIV
ncbi:putative phosphoesterase, alkaline-phosphatase-like, core domain superfamily [Dioscorea sansibarensis]